MDRAERITELHWPFSPTMLLSGEGVQAAILSGSADWIPQYSEPESQDGQSKAVSYSLTDGDD